MVVHRAVSAGVEGPTKSWQARFPSARRPRRRILGTPTSTRRLHRTRGLHLLLASRTPRSLSGPPPLQGGARRRRPAAPALPCSTSRRRQPHRPARRRASSRSSSGIRGSLPRSATCTPRRGPGIWSGSIWRSRPGHPTTGSSSQIRSKAVRHALYAEGTISPATSLARREARPGAGPQLFIGHAWRR